MRIIGALPDLTKSYILDRITEEDIMERYLNIPVNFTNLQGNSFLSPFREDNNPTCNYFYTIGGKLRLKDWSGDFEGDAFDVVGRIQKINSRNAQGFKLILNCIASEFGLHKYTNQNEKEKLQLTLTTHKSKERLKIFKIAPRKFNRFDEKFWTIQYGITEYLLRMGKVILVDQIYSEGYDGQFYKTYSYSASNPAYAYHGGEENGIKLWIIYFPFAKTSRGKFLMNKAFLQGKHLMRPYRFGIVAKSMKDALCYQSFGIPSAGLASETIILSIQDFFEISPYFDFMLSNTDYDRAGIRMAIKLRNKYKIEPLMFTRGRFGQPDYGVKDFSDFIAAFGRNKAEYLIFTLMEKYDDILSHYDYYNYKSLSWIKNQT